MGNFAIGPYEGEEVGEDRQEFMLDFVLVDTDPVKQAVINGWQPASTRAWTSTSYHPAGGETAYSTRHH